MPGNIITAGQRALRARSGDGFNACAVLFCAAPLGLLGAVADGLSGYFYLLAVKAIMDGLATLGFVKTLAGRRRCRPFRFSCFLAPSRWLCQLYARPFLESHSLHGVI